MLSRSYVGCAARTSGCRLGKVCSASLGIRLGGRGDWFGQLVHAVRELSKVRLVSPRLGLIYKALQLLSLYGSYSLTYLPRAGEQLSSLSLTNQALDPEEFRNYEVGAKWDVAPSFSFTAALNRHRGSGSPSREIIAPLRLGKDAGRRFIRRLVLSRSRATLSRPTVSMWNRSAVSSDGWVRSAVLTPAVLHHKV